MSSIRTPGSRRAPLDARIDLWSFGCALYGCLTGKKPFAGARNHLAPLSY